MKSVLGTATAVATIVAAVTAVLALVGGGTPTSSTNISGNTGLSNHGIIGNHNTLINNTTGQVEIKSDNPRKELAAMGISWDVESFRQAVFRKDALAVGLFIRGGMKYPVNDWNVVFNTSRLVEDENDYDKDVIQLLGRETFDNDKFCPTPNVDITRNAGPNRKDTWISFGWLKGDNAFNFHFNPELYEKVFTEGNKYKIDFIRRICGAPSVIAKIDHISDMMPYYSSLSVDDKKCLLDGAK